MARVLITGAAKRIGRQLALDMATAGHDIAIHYNSSSHDAMTLAQEIKTFGRKVSMHQDNLLSPDGPRNLFKSANMSGAVDVLINNASVYDDDRLSSMSLESWQRHMDINLRAPVFLAQAFASQLPKGVEGNVINIIDSRVWRLNPGHFSYTISKSALWTATRTMAQALAPHIRVNAIGPGPVLPAKSETAAEHMKDREATLLQRGTSPSEISAAALFILSQPALTGQMIALDGGQHLVWQTPFDVGVKP